jgi:hypothetical protein
MALATGIRPVVTVTVQGVSIHVTARTAGACRPGPGGRVRPAYDRRAGRFRIRKEQPRSQTGPRSRSRPGDRAKFSRSCTVEGEWTCLWLITNCLFTHALHAHAMAYTRADWAAACFGRSSAQLLECDVAVKSRPVSLSSVRP